MSAEPISYPSAASLAGPIPRWVPRVLVTARGWLRRVPLTATYVGTLAAVTVVMSRLDSDTQLALLRAASTNLDNLGRGDLSTLLTSAFVVVDPPSATAWLLLAGLFGAAELLWGSWRAAGVFLAGHVGATLVVAAGLLVAVRQGWAGPEVESALDVGVSYGVMALAGAATALLPPMVRVVWALGWLAGTSASVAASGDFTSVGHLCALAIGLGIAGMAIARGRTARTADSMLAEKFA
ncbi:MAG: hypothetical protein JWO79_3141 [Actinomycetia bacterium]|jgi:hypothetical protein|nr:hypothetical protein [Actinomycetes bacterium]MDQ1651791.1 hypothetical protein [Cryptosporangiaceae bacterium]MDQ1658550.1 hypothetical protein [Cryptosporangiaceae bacterium]